MHRKPDATGPARPAATAAAPDAAQLVALLRSDDLDAAIDAGLMAFVDDGTQALDAAARTLLVETQQRLRAAWDARERYRAREARLARRKAERNARRTLQPPAAAPKPALPTAAAAALARAKARAGAP